MLVVLKSEDATPAIGRLRRIDVAGFCVLAATLAALLLFQRPQQFFTGDEPRYVMYAVSLIRHHRFVMTLSEWHNLFKSTTGLSAPAVSPGHSGNTLMNSVYLSALLSPLAALFSLAGLRDAALCAGLTGLFYLFLLCRSFASSGAALLCLATAALTIPLLPYLHLFYMEVFVFALVCCGWERLQLNTRSAVGDLITAIVILVIPFVHMRGSVLAVALYAFLLYQQCGRGLTWRMTGFAVLALFALAILIVSNLSIYGSITGPVNSARPPTPFQWFSVFSMQLSNVRHGIVAYAPIWLLGYSGLLAGAIRKHAISRQGLVLATIAAFTAIGINPGFCWPARFWVIAIPMLTVGLCTWWTYAKLPALRLFAIALMGFSFLNTVIFIEAPNQFLFNQQTGTTYQMLFDKIGHFNFGLVWPVEVNDIQDIDGARDITIASALLVTFMGLAVVLRKGELLTIPAALILIAGLDLARVSVIPRSQYGISFHRDRLALRLHAPVRAAYVQFGHGHEMWFAPPYWPRFDVSMNGSSEESDVAANQVVPVSCAAGISSVTIKSTSAFDIASQAGFATTLYRSDSVLRNFLSEMRKSCQAR